MNTKSIAQKMAEIHAEKERIFNNITYGKLPLEARKIIFEAAWDHGHSAGENEVEYFYNDFTELVENVLKVMNKN